MDPPRFSLLWGGGAVGRGWWRSRVWGPEAESTLSFRTLGATQALQHWLSPHAVLPRLGSRLWGPALYKPKTRLPLLELMFRREERSYEE